MLTRDDLQFRMQIETDDTAITKAIIDLGKQINLVAGSAQSSLLATFKNQLDYMKFMKTLTQDQRDMQKDISAELATQEQLLRKIDLLMQPRNLKDQVEMEKKLTEARTEYQELLEKETVKQSSMGKAADAFKSGGFGAVLRGLTSDTSGFNVTGLLKQVMGGAGSSATNAQMVSGLIGGQQKGGGMLGQIGGAIGGAAGMMVGLPPQVGAMLGGMLANALPGVIAAPAQAVTKLMSGVSQGLQALQGNLGAVGLAFEGVETAMEAGVAMFKTISPLLGEIFGPALDALVAVPGILRDITSSITSMVGKANPGLMSLWGQALDDAQGVIGQTFIPMLETMLDMVRFFGDVLATVLPNTAEMKQALGGFNAAWAILKATLTEMALQFGPQLRDILVTTVEILGFVTTMAVQHLSRLATAISWLSNPGGNMVRLLFGGGQRELDTSVGAAARPASITGVEEYQRQLQINAFMTPDGISPEQQTANNTREMIRILGQIAAQQSGFNAVLGVVHTARGLFVGGSN